MSLPGYRCLVQKGIMSLFGLGPFDTPVHWVYVYPYKHLWILGILWIVSITYSTVGMQTNGPLLPQQSIWLFLLIFVVPNSMSSWSSIFGILSVSTELSKDDIRDWLILDFLTIECKCNFTHWYDETLLWLQTTRVWISYALLIWLQCMLGGPDRWPPRGSIYCH